MKAEIARVLKEVYPHKKRIALVAAMGIIYAASYGRLMMLIKDINDVFQKDSLDEIARVSQQTSVAAMAIGLALIVAITRYFQIFNMNYIGEMVANQMRLKLQKKFMALNLSFHNTYAHGSGGLLSRILNDIRIIQDGLRMIADFFREPILAVVLLFNLFYLNWRLTLAILIVVPIVLYFLKQISRSLQKYSLWGLEQQERMTSTIKESLEGVRTIQSFNLETELENKLTEQTNSYLSIRKKLHARMELMGPVTEFIATLVVLSIFFYFSQAISSGESGTGIVLAYIASMLAIASPIKKIQDSYMRSQDTVVAIRRVFSLIDEASEVPQDKSTQPFPQAWKKITYRNVSFNFGNTPVLKSINFEINKGEKLAFVGESGSGKSTILNLLERFYDPSSGQILIDNTPIDSIQLKDLRQHIALVSQDVFLFSDTIARNIQSGDFNKGPDRIVDMAKMAHAEDFINRLPDKYQAQTGEKGSLLSGGEKQRISIARAFFKDAPILILDEATSALDSASELEVQKGLDELASGRTALIVAHRISTIQNCDKIFVIKSGEIIESGTHTELLAKKGEYYRFYTLQTQSV